MYAPDTNKDRRYAVQRPDRFWKVILDDNHADFVGLFVKNPPYANLTGLISVNCVSPIIIENKFQVYVIFEEDSVREL